MNAVNLKRLELLEIVKTNMLKHIVEFNEAVIDYKNAVLKICEDNLVQAQTGQIDNFKKIAFLPTTPVSYENSYKRAIRMLELSVDDTIEVEEDVFNQLVLDEWDWKHSFSVSNASYKSVGLSSR